MTLNDLWIVTLAEQQMQYFYIVRSLHHQVFLDNLHALHYRACPPELLHFVCLEEAVRSEQRFHRASRGRAGSNRDSAGSVTQEPRFVSWMFVCPGRKPLRQGGGCGFSAQSVMSAILPTSNTDINVVVWFIWWFLISYLFALLIILQYHVGKETLMTTRHELGRLVLEIVPQ